MYRANTGEEIMFEPTGIELLDYQSLLSSKDEGKVNVKFIIDPMTFIFNNEHLSPNTVSMTGWKSPEKHSIYALTIGGWKPFLFLDDSLPIIVDRNIIDAMKKILKNSEHLKDRKWWFDTHNNTGLIFNPLLYAMENNQKKAPSFQEFCAQYDEACSIITRYSSSYRVITHSKEDYWNIYEHVVKKYHSCLEREIQFLCEVVPIIVKTIPSNKLPNIARDIKGKAIIFDVKERLSCFAVLDLLYEDTSSGKSSHSRKLLKPKENYSEDDAYNALSDLINLEVLLQYSRLDKHVFFCTADFHLAAFWVALGVKKVTYTKNKFHTEIDGENLFARANPSEKLKILE